MDCPKPGPEELLPLFFGTLDGFSLAKDFSIVSASDFDWLDPSPRSLVGVSLRVLTMFEFFSRTCDFGTRRVDLQKWWIRPAKLEPAFFTSSDHRGACDTNGLCRDTLMNYYHYRAMRSFLTRNYQN